MSPLFYFVVLLFSAAAFCTELWVMTLFSQMGWSNFGSSVLGMALFGLGLASVLLNLAKKFFLEKMEQGIGLTLALFVPVLWLSGFGAMQGLPRLFEAHSLFFLEKLWLCYFLIFLPPFLISAIFIGLVFIQSPEKFPQNYFANLSGSGLGGICLTLLSVKLMPWDLSLVILIFWILSGVLWISIQKRWNGTLRFLAFSLVATTLISPWRRYLFEPTLGPISLKVDPSFLAFTLIVATTLGSVLLWLPLKFRWREFIFQQKQKIPTLIYFLSVGAATILVIMAFAENLAPLFQNSSFSTMLVLSFSLFFSGLGSLYTSILLKNNFRSNYRTHLAIIFLLALSLYFFKRVLPHWALGSAELRFLTSCIFFIPLSFLMGIPLPLGMSVFASPERETLFIWAWGINGCFSVIGALLAPLLQYYWGVQSLFVFAMLLYLTAMLTFKRLFIKG